MYDTQLPLSYLWQHKLWWPRRFSTFKLYIFYFVLLNGRYTFGKVALISGSETLLQNSNYKEMTIINASLGCDEKPQNESTQEEALWLNVVILYKQPSPNVLRTICTALFKTQATNLLPFFNLCCQMLENKQTPSHCFSVAALTCSCSMWILLKHNIF